VLGEYPDGTDIISPVLIAAGNKSGPVLWMQGAIHGPEVGGVLGMVQFIRELAVADLSGTIICLAVANPLGFRANQRLTPQDGANLNRLFPGKSDGTITEQIAYKIFGLVTKFADAVIDFHSGGDHLICCHHALFSNDGSDAGQLSERLARSAGTPNLWNVPIDFLAGAAFSSFIKYGKPALLIESGGGARVTEQDLKNYRDAIRGACQQMSMLPGRPPPLDYRIGQTANVLKSTRGGIFFGSVEPGASATRNTELGRVVDLYGDVTETFHCPFDAAWVAAIRRPFMPIYSGEEVAEVVELTR